MGSNIHDPGLYDAFRDAVVKMANDRENGLQAYRKARIHDNPCDYGSMRKFLNQYAKLTDSSIMPIEQKERSKINMVGIRFTHDGQVHDMGLDDPLYGPYIDFFDKGYKHAMLYPWSEDEKTKSVAIARDPEDPDGWVIKPSDNDHASDPLFDYSLPLTTYAIERLHKQHPGCGITVKSSYYVDIQKDEAGNNVFTAYNPNFYHDGDDETVIMRTDKDTKPEDMFRVESHTYKFLRDKFQTTTRTTTEMLDLADYIGGNMDNPEIAEIHQDALDRKAGLITKSEYDYINESRRDDKTARRTDFFSMLTEYGTGARTAREGDKILHNNGYEPGAGRQEMLRNLSLIAQGVDGMKPYEINRTCSANRVNIGYAGDIGKAAGALMRMDITAGSDKGKVRIYPVFDRTEENFSQEPLAIAGIDPKTWEPVGVLRLDDPEARPIYDRMLQSIADNMGFNGKAARGSRVIPESEKPDFMKNGDGLEDDVQYE